MLNDEHIKVASYYANSHDVFTNVDIKDGIVTLLRKHFEPI